ncbi:hypothetical protein [Actinomadura kijaniata]|uniref:hypothetical protein n=1 Tax=Actinomadura kijaniata TaxID=46161 RepID=UPI000830162F|nr:hypothetical protein [Actinomadura kijaniata]
MTQPTETARGGRIDAVKRRWPTLVACLLAPLMVMPGDDPDPGGQVRALAEAMLMLPLIYLIVAKLDRRRLTWPVLFGVAGLFVVAKALDVVAPSVVLGAVALVVLLWGIAGGRLRRGDVFTTQAAGLVGFGALVLAGLVMDPDVGLYLVAAGWFLHGVWDFAHIRLRRTVASSFAEWCGIVDVLVAVGLIVLL